MSRKRKKNHLPDGGSKRPLAAVFRAAARFYDAAPWRVLDDTPLQLRLPKRAEPLYATVMGSGGLEYGLALYFSASELAEMLEGHPPAGVLPDALALTFGTERDLSRPLRAARKRNRWPVAGPAAFPLPLRSSPAGGVDDPDPGEMAMLSLALDTVREFVALHEDAVRVRRTVRDDVTVEGHTVSVEFPAPLPGGSKDDTLARLRRLEGELGIGETREGEGGRTPLFAEIQRRVLELPYADAALSRLAWSFFRNRGPLYLEDESEAAWEQAYARFMDWALYFASLPPDGSTLAERALAAAKRLSATERAERKRFVQPRYGVWLVEGAEAGTGLTLRAAGGTDRLMVRERMGSYQIRKGWTLIGPLFAISEREWVMGTMTPFPARIPHAESETLSALPQPRAALDLEGGFYGANTAWIEELEGRKEVLEVWETLRETIGRLYTWGYLERRIRESATGTAELLDALFDRTGASTDVEVDLVAALVTRAWNVTTRPELGGRSPDQMTEESDAGPEEAHLLREMASEVIAGLDPDAFPSPEAVVNEAQARMRAWLTMPREELDGRTPVEAMLAERRRSGGTEEWPGVEEIVGRLRLVSRPVSGGGE